MTPTVNPPAEERAEATNVIAAHPVTDKKPKPTSHAEALKSTSIIAGSKLVCWSSDGDYQDIGDAARPCGYWPTGNL
jgi:hypothetical protein